MRLGLRNIGLDPDKDVNLRVVGATNVRVLAMKQGQAQFTVLSGTEREDAIGNFKPISPLHALKAMAWRRIMPY